MLARGNIAPGEHIKENIPWSKCVLLTLSPY